MNSSESVAPLQSTDQHREIQRPSGSAWARFAVPDVLFLILSAFAFGFILYLGRFLTFFWDEFGLIYWRQDWSFNSLMQPSNEHWSLVPMVLYKTMFMTIGLRSYVPYLAVLLLLHVATAAALYRYARRDGNGLTALAIATVLLFFGAGYEYLFWGAGIFQLMAVAAGVWAVVLSLDGPPIRRPRTVATLLVVSIASAGMGLFFLAATWMTLILAKGHRRELWIAIPATVIYGLWYATMGHSAVSSSAFTLDSLVRVPEFLRSGVAAALGSLVGLGSLAGNFAGLFLVLLIAALFLIQRRVDRGVIVGTTGLVAQFVITGLVRDPSESGLSRYQYVAAVFILMIVASLARQLHIQFRRPVTVAVVAGIVVLSLVPNIHTLFIQRDWYLARADTTRALYDLTLRYGGSPALPNDQDPGGVNPPRGLLVVSTPAKLKQTVQDYGSLVTDAISGTFPISDAASDGVLFQIVQNYLVIGQAPAMPSPVDAISLTSSANVTTTLADGCLSVQPTGGVPQVVLPILGGRAVYVRPQDSGGAEVFISQHGVFAETFQMNYDEMPGSKLFKASAGQVTSITMPDLGPSAPPWLVRVDPPPTGTTVLCLGPAGSATGPTTVPSGGGTGLGIALTDTFGRNISAGWGQPDAGPAWRGDTTDGVSVDGTSGLMSVDAAEAGRFESVPVGGTDVAVSGRWALDALPIGAPVEIHFWPRVIEGQDYYRFYVTVTPSGEVYASFASTSGGQTSVIAGPTFVASGYAPGDWWWVNAEASGVSPTILRAQVWKDGTAEPSAWTQEVTDTTAPLQVNANAVQVGIWNSLGETVLPLGARFDDLTISAKP